jgi:DNA-binding IclR family transcriptional regulator
VHVGRDTPWGLALRSHFYVGLDLPVVKPLPETGAATMGDDGSVTATANPTESRSSGIQVIARAAEMLRALQASPGGLTQTDLAERLGLPRSTVHRILGALENEGLVASTRSRGAYRLGPEIARMADAIRRQLLARVHPYLQQLSRELNETVDLSVLDGDRVTFLDQVVAPQRLRTVSAIGESFPLHACAPGKAMLAALATEVLAALLPAQLQPLTGNTITSQAALRAELRSVRERGVGFDREEHTEGICAVGALVDRCDPTSMAVSVPLPSQRFHGREEELTRALLDTCAGIRQGLGAD